MIYKRTMYLLLILVTVLRLLAIAIMLPMGMTALPITVLCTSSFVGLLGLALMVKGFLGGVTIRQLNLYYIFETLIILFNLLFLRAKFPIGYSFHETLITGSFINIVLNTILVVLSLQQRRQILIARGLDKSDKSAK